MIIIGLENTHTHTHTQVHFLGRNGWVLIVGDILKCSNGTQIAIFPKGAICGCVLHLGMQQFYIHFLWEDLMN